MLSEGLQKCKTNLRAAGRGDRFMAVNWRTEQDHGQGGLFQPKTELQLTTDFQQCTRRLLLSVTTALQLHNISTVFIVSDIFRGTSRSYNNNYASDHLPKLFGNLRQQAANQIVSALSNISVHVVTEQQLVGHETNIQKKAFLSTIIAAKSDVLFTCHSAKCSDCAYFPSQFAGMIVRERRARGEVPEHEPALPGDIAVW